MFLFWLKEEQIIWAALAVSLLVHMLIFFASGNTFIPKAQFSVQASAAVQTVEISLEEPKPSKDILQRGDWVIKSAAKVNRTKQVPVTHSGVMVKANPDYFQNPPPAYPELAKQMRQEGLVLVSVDVDQEGRPIHVNIMQSSGHRLLDEAALKAVRHWRFQPGRFGNLPVESTVIVPVRFRLKDSRLSFDG